MLVHGFGEDGNVWNTQIDFLKKYFQLVVPDLPGSGQSEMTDDMSMEGLAEVIYSILNNENLKSCKMIGHSMGGYITLAFAEKYIDRLNAWGLFHSTAYTDNEEKKQTRKKGIEFIKQYGAFEFLKTAVPNLFSPQSKQNIPGKINDFIDSLHNFSADALNSYYETMMQRPDRSDVLKKSKIPVLLIMGEHDNAVLLKDGLELCQLPEKSYFHILHKSGHMGMIEEAEEANRILEKFLKEA